MPIAEPPAPRASTVAPDSRRMKAKHGYVQGYNAHFATMQDQIILAARVGQNSTDHHELPDSLEAVAINLAAAGITPTDQTRTSVEGQRRPSKLPRTPAGLTYR